MITFDANGYLTPHEAINVDLSIIEQYFVFNKHRKALFINYLRWLESFKSKVSNQFVQFIDGSFISQKEFPNDIDFVTFVDYEIYEREERFLDKYWSFSLENEGLDSYLVKVYPQGHQNYFEGVNIENDWKNRYSQKIIISEDKVIKKGFLILKFF